MNIVYTLAAMIVSYLVLPGSWSFWIILIGIIAICGIIYENTQNKKRNEAVDNEAKFQLDVENRKNRIRKENK